MVVNDSFGCVPPCWRGTRVILRGFQCGVSTKREEHMTTANGQTPTPFMQDAPAVISTLGTDAHQGLTSEQAAHNLNQYGPNAFTKPKPESMLSRIVKTAADPMLIMLMIAAAITLGVNITRAMAGGHADILECVGIFFAIALSVTITVVMEGRSAKAFEALNDINDDTTVTVVARWRGHAGVAARHHHRRRTADQHRRQAAGRCAPSSNRTI